MVASTVKSSFGISARVTTAVSSPFVPGPGAYRFDAGNPGPFKLPVARLGVTGGVKLLLELLTHVLQLEPLA